MKPLTQLCRRHKVRFWGRDSFVTPRLVDYIHGDGRQVLQVWPLANRPHYYILRVDSKLDLDEYAWLGLLDTICGEIEHQYGQHRDCYQHDNGRTYTKHKPFPALDDDYGLAWHPVAMLTAPDRRTEDQIRQAIAYSRSPSVKSVDKFL